MTDIQYAGLNEFEKAAAMADLHMRVCDAPTIGECSDCGIRLVAIRQVLGALDKAGLLLTERRRLDLLGNPMGWTPEQIRQHEEFNASLRFEDDES